MRALGRWIVAGIVLLLARGRRTGPAPEPEPPRILPPHRATGRSERAVLALLALATLGSAAFVILYALGASTQALGAALGLGLAALAAALGVAGRALVPQETVEEPHPPLPDREAERSAVRVVREAGEGITRRRLVLLAGGAAGGMLGAAVVTPLASLAPGVGGPLVRSRWRRGTPLVDDLGRRIHADDVTPGSFLTAFPQGEDPRLLGSPVVVVRLDPAELELPPDRGGWAPEGILAFSKICTHAGCAVSELRSPLDPAHSPRPALVCPCHYSTFDVRRGGDVIFGPAARALPQLPLALDAERRLVAGGGLSGEPGPSTSSIG